MLKLNVSKIDVLRSLMAVLLAVAVGLYLQGQVREATELRDSWSPGGAVLVANRDLEPGHLLEDDDVEIVSAPLGLTPPAALVTTSGETLGRVVARGSILTSLDLRSDRGPKPGHRWVAIPVDPGSRPALIAGDSVDLISADPFGGTARVATEAALVVEVTEDGVVVEVRKTEVAAVTNATIGGLVIVVLAPSK